jgi:serine/threonine-protein kinase RsbW
VTAPRSRVSSRSAGPGRLPDHGSEGDTSGRRFGRGAAGKVGIIIETEAAVRLELDSRPECVTLVRSFLAGLGETLALDHELLDDLKTATSEACNNVVLHAYGDGSGPLLLSIGIGSESLEVSVRDHGSGIRRVSSAEDRMGVGLAVISALAQRAEFVSLPGEGTEVRMSFDTRGRIRVPALDGRAPTSLAPEHEPSGDIVVSVSPPELLPATLGRMVRAVAAGAHFAVDRFPNLHQLTTAIARHAVAPSAGAGHRDVRFAITGSRRRLELQVAPLPPGSGDLFGGPPPAELEPLIETVRSERYGSDELVTVVVIEPRT